MKVKIVNKSPFDLPKYETKGSAGMDLRANFSEITSTKDLKNVGEVVVVLPSDGKIEVSEIMLYPNSRMIIPTGIYIQLPENVEAQIRPRSGLSFKTGLDLPNSPGTVDEDYTGEVGIIVSNPTDRIIIIKHGDRIAQMVFNKVEKCEWFTVDSLEETERGSGGFGHTGNK